MFLRSARSISISASVLSLAMTLSSVLSTCSTAALAQAAGNPGCFVPVDKLAMSTLPKMKGAGSGTLDLRDEQGKRVGQCALKHTDVAVHIAGYMASVDVKQTFQNPYNKKIEAEYKFPLSDTAAVDDMTMRVGERVIKGTIKRREEARQIYETARDNGYVASLLDQERPNLFTQSVANIEPGKEIEVTIHYVDLLPYQDGVYSFVFPTVVGPRFMGDVSQPTAVHSTTRRHGHVAAASVATAAAISSSGPAVALDAGQVSDALNPLFAKERTRSGHDISISVDMNAGIPVQSICCPLHPINIHPFTSSTAHIDLINQDSIPNKDFVLSWSVGADQVQTGYLTHREGKSGFITMMIMPPKRVARQNAAPKEMVFLIDRSGSQSGAPLDKAKETMMYILDHMNPNDTFQVISFSSDTETLFAKPEHPNLSALAKAKTYIQQLNADGGTYMGPAVKKVLSMPADQQRLKIVTFMTDGLIGNDMEMLSLIHNSRDNARWFPFGTGNSVNRFLIDGMAKEGGGEADYVLLNRPGKEVAEHFYKEIANPVLSDVKVEFQGVSVVDVLPHRISDVWDERPLYIKARYTGGGAGTAILRGHIGEKLYEKRIPINLPAEEKQNSQIAQIWAREAVDELMGMDWFGAQNGDFNKKLEEQVTQIALNFHIMSQFTSFVAVDSAAKTSGGLPVLTQVPVDMPEGVSLEGLFKDGDHAFEDMERRQSVAEISSAPSPQSVPVVPTVPSAIDSFTSTTRLPIAPWGSLINWLVASSRDANLFGGGAQESSLNFGTQNQLNSAATVAQAPVSSGASGGIPSQLPPAPPPYTAPTGVAVGDEFSSAGGGAIGDEFASASAQGKNIAAPMPAPSPMPVVTKQSSLTPPPPAVTLSSQASLPPPPLPAGSTYGSASQFGAVNGMPNLQGATNGTIGPQGVDATVITGLNTAGTVRVNNLANLEALLNVISWILDYCTIVFGIYLVVTGCSRLLKKPASGIKRILFGIVWMFAAPLCCVFLVPWLIWRGLSSALRKKQPKTIGNANISQSAIAPAAQDSAASGSAIEPAEAVAEAAGKE